MNVTVSKGEQTRTAIVGHALRLASAVGLEGLTIGGLADDLKLSKSGLFAHFGSKERLQIEVLEAAAQLFVDHVVRPAVRKPRGEPRIREMFERWLRWSSRSGLPGGCPFVAAAAELDDRPGPVRDALVTTQEQWIEALERAAKLAVAQGHFRHDLDASQFAFELYSLMLGAHYFARLLNTPGAHKRTRGAFEALIERARGR